MDTGKFTGFEVTLQKPGIAWIEFNEPEKLNGMNTRKKRDLNETLIQAQMDNAVRIVVFIGQGRGFCAGDDLSGNHPLTDKDNPLMASIPPGHDSPIGTYNGLKHISQALNLTIHWHSLVISNWRPIKPAWEVQRCDLASYPMRVASTCWFSIWVLQEPWTSSCASE